MQKNIQTVIFLLLGIYRADKVFAQQNKLDSLNAVLKTLKEDSNKVNTIIAITWQLNNINPDSSMVFSKRALALSENINWEIGIGKSYSLLTVINSMKGNYSLGIEYGFKSLSIWEKMERQYRAQNLSAKENASLRYILWLKSKTFGNLGIAYRNQSDFRGALNYFLKALKAIEEVGDKKSIIKTLNNLGFLYKEQDNYREELNCYNTVLKLTEELGNKNDLVIPLQYLGRTYSDKGDYSSALRYYFRALKISEESGDKKNLARVFGEIGAIYLNQHNYNMALDYFIKSLKLLEQLSDKKEMAITLGSIGIVYGERADYSMALKYYFKAMKIAEELNDYTAIAKQFGNIGAAYDFLNDNAKAESYYLKALKMTEDLGDKQGCAIWLGNIGSFYTETDKFKEAERFIQKSLDLSEEIGSLKEIKFAHNYFVALYEKIGKHKPAFEHYKKYIAARDSITNDEKTKEQTRLEMNYEFDKKEAETKAIQDKKDLIAQEEKQKQKIIIASVSAGLFLVFILALVILRSLRQNQKKNKIITAQKEIVEKQKELVEEKQKEILDSIYYARRIQRALITPEKYIETSLKKLNA